MKTNLTFFEKIARSSKNIGKFEPLEFRNVHPFDERNIHPDIAQVSIKLFDDGHYSQSTFEALKYIDNQVKIVSGIEDTGFNLMMNAFNETAPKIMLTDLITASDRDEQKGFRYIFAGIMSGVRNPRGHDNRIDPIDLCLDHLSVASILLRTLNARKSP